jgi:hypothetical protein
VMDLDPDKRDDAADEISGYQVGSGYYAQRINYDEAREIVAAVFPVIAEVVARATADAIADKIDAIHHEGMPARNHAMKLAAKVARSHGSQAQAPKAETTEDGR